MSDRKAIRVEPGIYYKPSATGKRIYEIIWRDASGKLKRRSTGSSRISLARTELTKEKAKRDRNEPSPQNPRLTFGAALDGYQENRVADLRETTQDGHRWAIENYLRPSFGNQRMDRISADDWAAFIRDCRARELAEGSIETILRSARGTYGYAARRLGWNGQNTLGLLERHELPSPEDKAPHRIFSPDELAALLRASVGQNKMIFTVGGALGSRISETLGLAEDNLDLRDLDAASISFTHQIDKRGKRVRLKTKSTERKIEIPRDLAIMLLNHMRATADRRGRNGNPRLAFCTKTGRALSRRNVSRELRATMRRARLDGGELAFPILSELDADGKPVKVERGQLPSFHSLRHGAASEIIAEGENIEEATWLLGHKDSTVTARVYVEEIKTAERSARRRVKVGRRIAGAMAA